MSFLHETILNDDFIWDVVTSYIPASRRHSTSGALKFKMNCPMCEARGFTADTRHRCGIFREPSSIGMYCFNCNFRTKFSMGRKLPPNLRKFLEAIGVPERDVKAMALRAHQVAGFVETLSEKQPDFRPFFDAISLPDGAQTIQEWHAQGCRDPDYLDVVDYLLSRGDVVATAMPYYWTPLPRTKPEIPDYSRELKRMLILPCYHEKTLVGWVGRRVDGGSNKYYKKTPKNFLFNSKVLSDQYRKYVIIVEGYFDALAVDGVAAMGVSLTEQQINWINNSGKIPIVVPDRDKAGLALAELAIRQEWAAAFPNYGGHHWWDNDIKDVDEAVKRHGRLYTVQSIIASHTINRIEIRQRGQFHI